MKKIKSFFFSPIKVFPCVALSLSKWGRCLQRQMGITLLLITLTACRKEQPEMTTEISNPCDCASEVVADFDILEISGQTGSIFEKTTPTDTILKNKSVRFLAKDSAANYTWYIGNEVLTDREVVRYFDNSIAGQDISISLVIKKSPNTICYPNDDGYDSIVKILHVSQYPIINAPTTLEFGSIDGTYRVKSEHKVDSFDVVFYTTLNSGQHKFNIENYDGNGTNCLDQAFLGGITNYRQVGTNSGTGTLVCEYLRGNIHNRLDGVAEMNFTTRVYNDENVLITYEWLYLGRKLN